MPQLRRRSLKLLGLALWLIATPVAAERVFLPNPHTGQLDLSDNTLGTGADADSTTTTAASGLEFINKGLTLLRGCAANQVLAWDETTDQWACATRPALADIDRLTTVTTTAGDTLILTSDGTHNTLTIGRASADLLFKDSTATTLFRIHGDSDGSTGTSDQGGAAIIGHLFVGYGTSSPSSGVVPTVQYTFQLASDDADTGGNTLTSFRLASILNGDRFASSYDAAQYLLLISDGFDPDQLGAGTITMTAHRAGFGGSVVDCDSNTVGNQACVGSVSALTGFLAAGGTITLPNDSPVWGAGIGGDFKSNILAGTNNDFSQTYGLIARSAGDGAAVVFSAVFQGGSAQINGTNPFRFGVNAITSLAPNYIQANTAAGTILDFGVNSADEVQLTTTAWRPAADAGNDLGTSSLGWGDAYLTANGSYFIGTEELTFSSGNSDFELSDDLNLTDATPHLQLIDDTANEDDFEWYADGSQCFLTNVTDGVEILGVDGGNNVRNLRGWEVTRCLTIDDLIATDDNISLGMYHRAITVQKVGCSYNGTGTTVATIALEDGAGNAMTHTGPTCAPHGTDATFQAVTSAGGLNAGEIVRFDTTNTPAPLTDDYTICISYTVNNT